MEYQEFLSAVERKMNLKMTGGMHASLHEAVKNNGEVKRGVLVESPGINISPAFYLEEVYQRYQSGDTLDQLVDELLKCYQEVRCKKSLDITDLETIEGIRDKVVFKLIHSEKNRALLKEIPHREILDLSIVFYLIVDMEERSTATILIRNEHLKVWGMDEEQLLSFASENVQRLIPPQLFLMREIVEETLELGRRKPINLFEYPENLKGEFMYVLTNSHRNLGAAAILYPGVQKKIAEILNGGYYVIPSSVHEMIIVPMTESITRKELDQMVKEVNENVVDPEEILSDHVYIYDAGKEVLQWVFSSRI